MAADGTSTLRRAGWLVGLLLVVWLAFELVAPVWLSARIESRVAERTRGALTVQAEVGSFPLIGRLATTGRLERLRLTVEQVVHRPVPLTSLRFELDEVAFDRIALLGGDVEVTSVGGGRFVAAEDDLPTPVVRAIDAAVSGGGPFDVAVVEDAVALTLPVVGTISIDVPSELVPCAPSLTVAGRRVVLVCAFQEPPELLQQGFGLANGD